MRRSIMANSTCGTSQQQQQKQSKEEYASLISSSSCSLHNTSSNHSSSSTSYRNTGNSKRVKTKPTASLSTTTITISHRPYSEVAIFFFSIIGIFFVASIYNTYTNYEFSIKLDSILSTKNGDSRGTRIIDKEAWQQQSSRTEQDQDDEDDDKESHSLGGSSRSNRLGIRFRDHGAVSINNDVNANSNTAVMRYNGGATNDASISDTATTDVPVMNSEDQQLDDDDGSSEGDVGGEQSPNDNDTSNDEILFQREIRKNFNASLYRNYNEFSTRSQRFPSVAERVKVYMSNWYLPPRLPCNLNDSNDPRIRYKYQIQTDPLTKKTHVIVLIRQSSQSPTSNIFQYEQYNTSILLQLDMVPTRTRSPFIYNHTYIAQASSDHFLQDARKYFIPSLARLQYPDTSDIAILDTLLPPIPIVLQQGDSEQYKIYSPTMDTYIYRPYIPIMKKYRYSMNADELERVTTTATLEPEQPNCDVATTVQPIEQPTRVSRTIRITDPYMRDYKHDRSTIPQFVQPIISILSNYERHFNPLNDVVSADRPWDSKKNMAIYRGALTGTNRLTTSYANDIDEEMKDVLYCQEIPRCSLVLNHGHSQHVNAKLVASKTKDESIKSTLQNVTIFGEGMTFQQMLEYKAIIMLEGNDVSTGLKWSLYSNSVVLTPKPTCTSWAMEELLVPYVHYIPLYDNLTNVEEQVQWMLEHDEEAKQIAYNGKLWMLDLVYHTDVKKDTEDIIDETFRRYMKHFHYSRDLQE